MDIAERAAQLDTAIGAALAHMRVESEWDRRYLRVQRDWLARLLPRWLEVELARPPFTVIATERALREQKIGPLTINIRVDRIDTVPVDKEGAPDEVILDYKTGPVSRSAWFDDRLEQAQLPLYAVLTPDRLTGVAFAKLRTGEMKIDGVSAQSDQIKKTRKKKDGMPYANSEVHDLAAEIDTWREKLTSIAAEFAAGHSAVTPKHYLQTCTYCAQMPLCRIQEGVLPATLDDEEAQDG
jgi:RecB family exonuclease